MLVTGGGGSIGNDIVRVSPPDGYTLLTGSHSGMVAAPLLIPAVKYHPLKDFTPITQMVNSPFFLVAHAQLPANNLKELIALMKAQPGKLNYGSVGQGSSTHLAFEMFAFTAGIQALHVPYKGTTPMVVDLLAGTLQLTITSIPTVLPYVIAFAAGSFLYVAMSDLIPNLHKGHGEVNPVAQVLLISAGLFTLLML